MVFVTQPLSPRYPQMKFEDLLYGTNLDNYKVIDNKTNTRTDLIDEYSEAYHKLLKKYSISAMIQALEGFNSRYEYLFEADRASLYRKFYIPKKSGGLREINAPDEPLMKALKELKTILEDTCGHECLYHTAAFAYVKGRSTIDAAKRHQSNGSRWFGKFDFHDFFGSTTEVFVWNMFSSIFPFNEIMKVERGETALKKALSLCFLNGGLPQGTPVSPTITNIMMIPFDHTVFNNEFFKSHRFCYTRYADDLLISAPKDFNCNTVQDFVLKTLEGLQAPFSLNTKKTHYGSSAGRNWMLGVMLNKDNEITIGHEKKKQFKAMLYNYSKDKLNGVVWELHDIQVLQGLISYYRMVESDNIDVMIKLNNDKLHVDVEALIKKDLNELVA